MIIKIQTGTPTKVKNLVFNILDVFQLIGIPVDNTDRKLERMAKACLAVGKIKKDFSEACSFEDGFTRTRDIITFENKNFGEDISPGSYDDIRRQDLKLLVEAGIVVNSSSTEETSDKQSIARLWLKHIICESATFFWFVKMGNTSKRI